MLMKNKILKLFIVIYTMLPLVATAGIITLGNGNITSDTDSDIIVDHLNQREYLRFDVLGQMTYQEQVDITTTGIYSDFSIANHLINFDFINALLDGNTGSCSSGINTGFCNVLNSNDTWSEGDLGLSYQADYDYWLYENTVDQATTDFSLAGIRSFGTVYSYSNWGNEASVNFFGNSTTLPIHLLMYRDISPTPVVVTPVTMIIPPNVELPEPASFWLLFVALLLIPFKRLIN